MVRPDRSKPIEDQAQPALLAMLIWGEARGQSPRGQLAVAHVALNRASFWGQELGRVILAPLQFSCFNSPADRERLMHADVADSTAWASAASIAQLALEQLTLDPSRRATHYTTAAIWGREPADPAKPRWFEAPFIRSGKTVEYIRIGDHVFGKAA